MNRCIICQLLSLETEVCYSQQKKTLKGINNLLINMDAKIL